eukprot:s11072_g1.t1
MLWKTKSGLVESAALNAAPAFVNLMLTALLQVGSAHGTAPVPKRATAVAALEVMPSMFQEPVLCAEDTFTISNLAKA